MIRLTMATLGILMCIKTMSDPTDSLAFGVCGLFIPIFFFYGWMAIEKIQKEKDE